LLRIGPRANGGQPVYSHGYGPRRNQPWLRAFTPSSTARSPATRRCFAAAGVGPEFYPDSPDQLARELTFHPLPGEPFRVHLPRDIRLLEEKGRDRVCAFAERFREQPAGLLVHDQPELASRFDDYVAAVRALDARLRRLGPGPVVHIEYAAGVPPEAFVALFEAVRDCPRVAACIDVSHIGIRQCQRAYERLHPGEDVCRLKLDHPELPVRIDDVQAACVTALPVVVQTVTAVGRLGQPLHFHLHDGHPASTYSAYGVSDHLSFFHEVVAPFSYRGSRTLPPLFGPLGLKKILDAARSALPDELLSLTIEVHPQEGRLGLGEYAGLFRHWQDRDNAERMNHWVEQMLRCARLAREACA
jgi:hypothetical protein